MTTGVTEDDDDEVEGIILQEELDMKVEELETENGEKDGD